MKSGIAKAIHDQVIPKYLTMGLFRIIFAERLT